MFNVVWPRLIQLLAAVALLASAPLALAADPPDRVVHVGFLSLYPRQAYRTFDIVDELAKLGYVEGRNLVIDSRDSGGGTDRLAVAALELVKLKVDVIFAVTNPAAFAAKNATRTIPIVAWASHGAVETGLVSSLRRPGGNITGIETLAPELDAKRLQLFKQLVPALGRMAVVADRIDQGIPYHLEALAVAGKTLGVTMATILEIARIADFDAVLATAANRPLDAMFMLTTDQTVGLRRQIFDFAAARKLPTMCEFKFLVEAGCLMSYGPTFDEITQRCAAQIDKILRGTPPGELPIEQPTRFELAINLKTARALGLSVPKEMLQRADAVIE
jgi:putative ABC transport system substrate-binding protein